VYIDAERTDYYGKFTYRFFSSLIMEFVWSDQDHRSNFNELGKTKPGLYLEFCNLLLNDMNNMIFEGILALEDIRNYESLHESGDWN
jgi:hypothetical protein